MKLKRLSRKKPNRNLLKNKFKFFQKNKRIKSNNADNKRRDLENKPSKKLNKKSKKPIKTKWMRKSRL
jgi:hypothetical protein